MQNIIVAIIIVLAVAYTIRGVVRVFRPKKRGNDCDGGCDGGCKGCC